MQPCFGFLPPEQGFLKYKWFSSLRVRGNTGPHPGRFGFRWGGGAGDIQAAGPWTTLWEPLLECNSRQFIRVLPFSRGYFPGVASFWLQNLCWVLWKHLVLAPLPLTTSKGEGEDQGRMHCHSSLKHTIQIHSCGLFHRTCLLVSPLHLWLDV